MKRSRKAVGPVLGIIALLMASCGSKDGQANGYPADNLNDTAKVSYMMQRCEPDSVARYICNTFLGWNQGCTLDTMANAVAYAYTHYQGDKLVKFSETFDTYANSLPLPQRMIILSKAAVSDADGLGYRLGLDYAAEIQSQRKQLKDIDAEMAELRKACGADTLTYLRVLNGLSVALSLPEYSNLPADVRAKYGTAPAIPQKIFEVQEGDAPDKIKENKQNSEPIDNPKDKPESGVESVDVDPYAGK